jgi:hypothetical protein
LTGLGLTDPNDKGHQYRHGTPSAYNAGKCRCPHCRAAMASYRATRRATGRDNPRSLRPPAQDPHIPRGWFRTKIWLPSTKSAKLDFKLRFHDLATPTLPGS